MEDKVRTRSDGPKRDQVIAFIGNVWCIGNRLAPDRHNLKRLSMLMMQYPSTRRHPVGLVFASSAAPSSSTRRRDRGTRAALRLSSVRPAEATHSTTTGRNEWRRDHVSLEGKATTGTMKTSSGMHCTVVVGTKRACHA